MYLVKQITAEQTYPVRHAVLRQGKPLDSCRFEGDSLDTAAHFGIFGNDALAGVVSVFKTSNKMFSHKGQFQVRGMAVLPAYRGAGLGERLLKHTEDYVATQHGELIWLNARESAAVFYEKNCYKRTGMPFDIPGIGFHYLMQKSL